MLKIGILIKDFKQLRNWELRIIQGIIDDLSLLLTVLIQDGRRREKGENPNKLKHKLFRSFRSEKKLFKLQIQMERKIYPEKITANKKDIIKYLLDVPLIKLHPLRKGFLDIFSIEDSRKVKDFDLDIILRHEFNIIRGEILNSSKYGIWSFYHADNSINRGGPAGFWEIVLKQPNIGVTLQELTPELDGGKIIDKAYFNMGWSFVVVNRMVLENSVSLLFKNIKKLQRGGYSPTKSKTYYNPLYKYPNFINLIKYILGFYLFKRMIQKINVKIFNVKYVCWTLFIGKGSFLESTLFRLKPVKLPKNEFWADPFLFKYEENYYVFFENYSYSKKKAKISCGRVANNNLVNICDVMDLEYHLSFPFIFAENGEIYLMPESNKNKRLEIYKCLKFPNKWELYSTAFEGEIIYDAHFYTDKEKQKWLFANKRAEAVSTDSELYIYKVDSLKMNKIEEHKQNPVLIDSRVARNGGTIFEHENKLYRPSQYNADGLYGKGLNINKIKKLTIDEYVEEKVIRVMPNFYKGLVGIHHLHQLDDLFVIDAAFYKKF